MVRQPNPLTRNSMGVPTGPDSGAISKLCVTSMPFCASALAAACRVSAEGADEVGREQEHTARITGTKIAIRSGFIRRNVSAIARVLSRFLGFIGNWTKPVFLE